MFSGFFNSLLGFESDDDRTTKILKVFAGVAQALFVIMFFAYEVKCLSLSCQGPTSPDRIAGVNH